MSSSIRHLIVVATFLLSWGHVVHGVKFLLTLPEQPHFDSQYTATITAYDVISRFPERVKVEYRGLKDSSRVIHETELLFKSDGVQTWAVTFPWAIMDKYGEAGVVLKMSSRSFEDKKTLYFSRDTGYIFIQTDKPVYTPRQTVKFRIIAVDEYQRLAKYPIKVEIRNEKMIIMDRVRYSAEDAFKGQEFELPKETPPGEWTISANYGGIGDSSSNTQTITFEVKEYVLPRFFSDLKISEDVITKDTNRITITVTSKYVYGYYTMGTIEVQLGIWDPQDGLTLLPQRYNANLTRGVYKKDIRISKLIPRDMFIRANRRLYVAINVTEDGTGENDTIVDTSTFIAHPYYEITHTESRTHFKPGFPYTLHTSVRARNGRPASWVVLHVTVRYVGKDGKTVKTEGTHTLNGKGALALTQDVPSGTLFVQFLTKVLDSKAGSNVTDTYVVTELPQEAGQYLHIQMEKPITKTADGIVRLRYTPPPRNAGTSHITIMVLSKGHKVYSDSTVRKRSGQSVVTLPRRVHSDVSPSMRIVATYYHQARATSEFVFDSLLVDTEDVCLEKLTLSKPGGRFASRVPKKPKDEYKLLVTGGPHMKVGFVAVDTAVFLLNDNHAITRESVFKQLESHDQGKGVGDGVTMKEVMKNSGLLYLFLETATDFEHEPAVSGALVGGVLDSALHNVNYRGRNKFILDVDTYDREWSGSGKGYGIYTQAPPQTVRKYFPESWLFQEDILPKSGKMTLNLTLPDSITTWSFMAVGVSATRGVCVSERLEQEVLKKFFVELRLPYKATRLEEIKVKVAVYNYQTDPIKVLVTVTGLKGLCMVSNSGRGTNQNSTRFNLKIGAGRTRSRYIKMIPLENGELTVRVNADTDFEKDIVERNIFVVAEGMPMRKSLTFVLDPEAKHSLSFQFRKNRRLLLSDTATIKHVVNLKRKTQRTEIDLSLPKEVIRGTESCKISAFGDLMGDIINHAVIKSKSLMDPSVHNAEEVLGDLGPTVHALLYANMSGLMDEEVLKRSQKFIKCGVARLLKYRTDQAFALTPTSPEGTWLTAAVLKALCHSSKLAFIDKSILIDHGFYWLLSQARENGTLEEKDWRLAKNSHEYRVMLSADVMIAILECGRHEHEDHSQLVHEMAFFTEDNFKSITEPMVLAKMAYAFTLYEKLPDVGEEVTEGEEVEVKEVEEEVDEFEEGGEEEAATMFGEAFSINGAEEEIVEPEPKVSEEIVKRLISMSKKNSQGQVYWSNEEKNDEDKKVPFWYHQGVQASAIEATAYALLVFLSHPGANVDAIADWLVSQRNRHGSFIGALDSMAAIQALSAYSLQKTDLTVDLSCLITSDQTKQYSHSLKFTEHNAMRPESLNDVPVGHHLNVVTKGKGLGQMQINVEYNVPIDPNEKCEFNMTVEVKQTTRNFYPDMHDNPLCEMCSWWCPPNVDIKTFKKNATIAPKTFWNYQELIPPPPPPPRQKPPPLRQPQPPPLRRQPKLSPVRRQPQPPPLRRQPQPPPLRRQPQPPPLRRQPQPPPLRRQPKLPPRPYQPLPRLRPPQKSSCSNLWIRASDSSLAGPIRVEGGRRIILRLKGRGNRKKKNKQRKTRTRKPRSVTTRTAVTYNSICIKVCIKHLATGGSGPTRVAVDMLSGFQPVASDIERIKEHPDVFNVWFEEEFDRLTVEFKEVSDEYPTCVGLRAVDHEQVDRAAPAKILVTEVGRPAPSCAQEYRSPLSKESLRVYCAELSHQNRGECKCYSGQCSQCYPAYRTDELKYFKAKELVCQSKVGYQVQLNNFSSTDQWIEIDAKILSTNRTGLDPVKANDNIKIRSPVSCSCPEIFQKERRNLYMISPDVENMVDRFGNIVKHYLLDEQASFIKVSDPYGSSSTRSRSSSKSWTAKPALRHEYLRQAFRNCDP